MQDSEGGRGQVRGDDEGERVEGAEMTRATALLILLAALTAIVCGAAQAGEPKTVAIFIGGVLAGFMLAYAIQGLQEEE